MKIQKDFAPVTIKIDTEEELRQFKRMLQAVERNRYDMLYRKPTEEGEFAKRLLENLR